MIQHPRRPGYMRLLLGQQLLPLLLPLLMLLSAVSCIPEGGAPLRIAGDGPQQPSPSPSADTFTPLIQREVTPTRVTAAPRQATSSPRALQPEPHATSLAVVSVVTITPKADRATAQPEVDRTPTRLVIPAIKLDAPIEAVGWHIERRDGAETNVWDTPNYFAAGWLKTLAPLGMPGNTVLDGHHNVKGKVFKDLHKLQVGDTLTVYAAGLERVYRIDQVLILRELYQSLEIRQANARYINPTADERVTLVTCWPARGNSHRLIIIALPLPTTPRFPHSE